MIYLLTELVAIGTKKKVVCYVFELKTFWKS